MPFVPTSHLRLHTALVAGVLTALPMASLAQEASIDNAGQFSPLALTVGGVTNDGTTVVGSVTQSGVTSRGFTYSKGAGVQRTTMALDPSGTFINGVSGDGSRFVGSAGAGPATPVAYVTLGSVRVGRGPANQAVNGVINAASDDGNIVVGAQNNSGMNLASVWDVRDLFFNATELTDPNVTTSVANDVSADGTVVVGDATLLGGGQSGFFYDRSLGGAATMVMIGTLPGGVSFSTANAVSADGTTVVGSAQNAGFVNRAIRWTQADGIQELGDLDGTVGGITFAEGVSGDGSIIVGTGITGAGERAFRWTADTNTQNLMTLLQDEGVDLTGTVLTSAVDITPDGKYIVGVAEVDFGMGAERTAYIALYDATPDPEEAEEEEDTPAAPAAGVIFPTDFTDSANSIGTGLRFGGQAARLASDGLFFQGINTPLGGQSLGFAQAPGKFGGFVFGQGQQLLSSAPDDATTGSGGAGVTYTLPGGLLLGTGALALRHQTTSSTLGSTAEITGLGAGAFLRYGPRETGPQLMFNVTRLALEAKVDRNYRNGGAIETASGDTKGRFTGVKARFGWGMALSGATVVTPFADVSRSSAQFDGYTETGGLFRGVVSAQESRQTTVELGAQVSRQVSPKLRLSGGLSAQRFSESGTQASVAVTALNGATFGGGAFSQQSNAVRAEFGVSYDVSDAVRVTSGLSVRKGLSGASDLDEASLTVGVSFSF